jgi:hypothetical protein
VGICAYFNFGIGISGIHMVATVDEVAKKLAGTRATELRRIILLFDQARLCVDHKPESANFLSPVDGMTLSVEQNQKTAVRKWASTDNCTTAVEEEGPQRRCRACARERIPGVVVDEVDREHGLEDVA